MRQSGLVLSLMLLCGCSTGGFDLSFSPSLPSAPSYGYSDYNSYESVYGYGSGYGVGYADPAYGSAYGTELSDPGYAYGMGYTDAGPAGHSHPAAPPMHEATENKIPPAPQQNTSEMQMLLTELRELIQAQKAPKACDCEPVTQVVAPPAITPLPVAPTVQQPPAPEIAPIPTQVPAYLPLDELFALRGYNLPAQPLPEARFMPPERQQYDRADRRAILPWLQEKSAHPRDFKGQAPHFFQEHDAQGHARIWIQIDMLKVDDQWRPETQLQEIVDELYLALQEIETPEASS